MKFLAVFAALVAVACANNTWTLQQLSESIQSPYTDPALKPYLEAALNSMMESIFAGEQVSAVTVTIPAAVDYTSMNPHDLADAIQNPETDPALLPVLEDALNIVMESLITGVPVQGATVATPAMEIHYYTLSEISMHLEDPTTNPELIPYFTNALSTIMDALWAGQQMESIVMAVPAGLHPIVPAEVAPAPVDSDAAVIPAPVDADAVVVPAEIPSAASSPLVQIVVNVNQQ